MDRLHVRKNLSTFFRDIERFRHWEKKQIICLSYIKVFHINLCKVTSGQIGPKIIISLFKSAVHKNPISCEI